MGGSHIGTGGDRYLMAIRPSEGSRATREALASPTRENIRRYLACTSTTRRWSPTSWWTTSTGPTPGRPPSTRRRKQSVSVPHDYTPELAGIQAPVLLIHGRYDRMVAFRGEASPSSTTSRLARGAPQQLRPLAALREARGVHRPRADLLKGY